MKKLVLVLVLVFVAFGLGISAPSEPLEIEIPETGRAITPIVNGEPSFNNVVKSGASNMPADGTYLRVVTFTNVDTQAVIVISSSTLTILDTSKIVDITYTK